MITKYITHIKAAFNPLAAGRTHKIPRLILSRLPSSAAPGAAPIKVSTEILAKHSDLPGKVTITFRDGKEVFFDGASNDQATEEGRLDLNTLTMNDVIEELDRHSRLLRRKDEISGN